MSDPTIAVRVRRRRREQAEQTPLVIVFTLPVCSLHGQPPADRPTTPAARRSTPSPVVARGKRHRLGRAEPLQLHPPVGAPAEHALDGRSGPAGEQELEGAADEAFAVRPFAQPQARRAAKPPVDDAVAGVPARHLFAQVAQLLSSCCSCCSCGGVAAKVEGGEGGREGRGEGMSRRN